MILAYKPTLQSASFFLCILLGRQTGMFRNHLRTAALIVVLLLQWNCGPPPAPPGPGEARGAVPDMRGYTVMVLPVQLRTAVPSGVLADEELAHALQSRGEGVAWVFPPELDHALERSPGLSARIRGLPVQVFDQAQVDRIGDPLFGNLVRLGSVTGADVALIPVGLEYGEDGAYLLRAALVGVGTGRVSWFGVVEGEPGEARNPATLASVTEKLARTLLPFG